jgi:nucleotide-binding universal stress UspA family protein
LNIYLEVRFEDLIKKILVALDGSEHANNALDYALDLAEKCSATIVLLSVYKFPVSCYYAPPEAMEDCLEAQKDQHGKVLSEALERVKKMKPDLKVSIELVEGRAAEKIVETAEEGDFDIIVMGSRGLGGVREFLLGSVSDRVADHAKCPVLIVK